MQTYSRTIEQMMADSREKLILDLRKDREFRLGTIPGAVHIYWEDLNDRMAELPKDKPIYMMCYTGETSDEFAAWMQEHGWEAYSIEDGYRGFYRWQIMQE